MFDKLKKTEIENLENLIKTAKHRAEEMAYESGLNDFGMNVFSGAYTEGFIEGYVIMDFVTAYVSLADYLDDEDLIDKERMTNSLIISLQRFSRSEKSEPDEPEKNRKNKK